MGTNKLPRRRRADTLLLFLAAGEIVADEVVTGRREDLTALWLAHLRFDDVLPIATRLQAYLFASGLDLEEVDASDPQVQQAVRQHDASAYRTISKPTMYTVFDSEHDFRAQLARWLLRGRRVSDPASLIEGLPAMEEGDDAGFSAAIDRLADAEFIRVRDLPAVYLELGTAPFLHDDTIRSALRDSRHDSAYGSDGNDGLIAFYERLLAQHGRRMRPGLQVRDLYVALTSLTHGMLFHTTVWPESAEHPIADGGRARSLFAISCEALLVSFTEPVTGPPEPTATSS